MRDLVFSRIESFEFLPDSFTFGVGLTVFPARV